MSRRLVTWTLLAAGAGALACTSGLEPGPVSGDGAGAPARGAESVAGSSASLYALASPAPDDCGDPGKSRRERIQCKFAALADQGIATADALVASPAGAELSPAQLRAVGNMKVRLEKEKARGAERMSSLGRRRDARCPIAECDGTIHSACPVPDGDGVCEAGEGCLEVLGDGIGDDLQPCAPTKGARREECVRTCDDEAVCRDEENLDPALEDHLEGELDEAMLHGQAVERGLRAAQGATVSALAALDAVEVAGDPCALDAKGHARKSDELAKGLETAAVHLRGLTDVAERACDQAILGFNCAGCCVFLETMTGLVAVANEHVQSLDDVVSSATLDAALSCVAEVNRKAGANEAELKLLEESLLRVEATQEEVVRLLLTPPGLRPGYPQP
jgi:hypothetical protein